MLAQRKKVLRRSRLGALPVWGLGVVSGLGFRVQGSGFRVFSCRLSAFEIQYILPCIHMTRAVLLPFLCVPLASVRCGTSGFSAALMERLILR